MARRNKPRSTQKGAAQKSRTASNQRRRYEKLIAERPNDPHRKAWEKFL